MEKIRVKLDERYTNQFLTTVDGYVISHDKWTEVNANSREIQLLLEQPGILVVDNESLKVNESKTIVDEPKKETIKEVVGKKVEEENKQVINEMKKEEKEKKDAKSGSEF